MEAMIGEIGVELKGEVEVQYRSGRWRPEAERPRPLVLKVKEDEDRETIYRNAKNWQEATNGRKSSSHWT